MFCPKCGNEQPEGVNFCQKCGHAFAAPAQSAATRASGGCSKPFLIIAGVLVGLLVLLFAYGSTLPESKPPDVATERGAWSICQTFVGRQLKAPSTASYASLTESLVTTNGASGVYAVTSYVDAQNSFGAQIRTPFQCNVQYQSGGNWTLLSLNMDQP